MGYTHEQSIAEYAKQKTCQMQEKIGRLVAACNLSFCLEP